MPSRRKPSTRQTYSLGGLLLLIVLAACINLANNFLSGGSAATPEPTQPVLTPGRVVPGAPGALPDMPNKPKPVEAVFKGCPPEGDGSDPVLNRNKNRVDEGDYIPVQIDAILQLKWPPATERKDHANWSASDSAFVARYEGIPVSAEGYLAGAREEGPESTNCHGADHEFHDFHIWLTKTAGADRSNSIVVEVTPRMRAKHSSWTVPALGQIARNQTRVRISGWLMLDPEHPDQVGQTRGTIWEIHPIMQIEVEQSGQWIALDNFAR